jgi:hypothetical protein
LPGCRVPEADFAACRITGRFEVEFAGIRVGAFETLRLTAEGCVVDDERGFLRMAVFFERPAVFEYVSRFELVNADRLRKRLGLDVAF